MYYIYLFKNFSPISLSAFFNVDSTTETFFNEISKKPFISEVIDIPSLIDCCICTLLIKVDTLNK